MSDCGICTVFDGIDRAPTRLIYLDDIVGAWHEDDSGAERTDVVVGAWREDYTGDEPTNYLGVLRVAPRRHVRHLSDLPINETLAVRVLASGLLQALHRAFPSAYRTRARDGRSVHHHACVRLRPDYDDPAPTTPGRRDWLRDPRLTDPARRGDVVADLTAELRRSFRM